MRGLEGDSYFSFSYYSRLMRYSFSQSMRGPGSLCYLGGGISLLSNFQLIYLLGVTAEGGPVTPISAR